MGAITRGAFIVIEGVDRSGKSTQCKKLVQSLRAKNIEAELMNFPDRSTSTGKIISQYLTDPTTKLNDHAIHLLFAANRWENAEKLQSLLGRGINLVVDRYSYSGIAFSAAKTGMDIEWCKRPENGLPKPDLVMLLTLNPEEAAKRSGFGNERYENETMQKNVARIYSELCEEGDNWRVIDASGSIQQVQDELLDIVLPKIDFVKSLPLQYLNFDRKIR